MFEILIKINSVAITFPVDSPYVHLDNEVRIETPETHRGSDGYALIARLCIRGGFRVGQKINKTWARFWCFELSATLMAGTRINTDGECKHALNDCRNFPFSGVLRDFY